MRRKSILLMMHLLLLAVIFYFSYTVVPVSAGGNFDLAVTSVSVNATSAVRGETVEISVDVKNNNLTHTIDWFIVNSYFDIYVAAPSQNVTYLGPGSTRTLTFNWITDDPLYGASGGNYTISAKISSVLPQGVWDENVTNNELDDGYVVVTAHDVAVNNVIGSPTGVTAGQPVQIKVTVENKGDYYETFDVTVYWNNSHVIDTETVTALANKTSKLLTFTWDTSGHADGNYEIGANASAVTGECPFDVERNNRYVDGIIRIPAVHDIAVTGASVNPTIFSPGMVLEVLVEVRNEGDCDETFDVTVYYDTTVAMPPQTVNLASRSNTGESLPVEELTFNWDTTGVSNGSYTVKAVASTVSGETDTADNTMVDGEVYAPNNYVVPSSIIDTGLTPGSTFTVDIKVSDIVDLCSFEFYMRWNGPILDVTDVTEGPFLPSGVATPDGGTFFTKKMYNTPDPKGVSNYIYVTDVLTGALYLDVFPVSGDGVLATVEFYVEDVGRSGLDLYATVLVDPYGDPMPHMVVDGNFDNESWAARGEPGDVDGDHDVDIVDLCIVARAMGTDPTWPHGTGWGQWNPDADLNDDLKVNIFDLFIVAVNYGEPRG